MDVSKSEEEMGAYCVKDDGETDLYQLPVRD